MRCGSVQCGSLAVAQRRCPWASVFVPVPGGFLVFESAKALEWWRSFGARGKPGVVRRPSSWLPVAPYNPLGSSPPPALGPVVRVLPPRA